MSSPEASRLKRNIRVVVAIAMIAIGVLHFANPDPFVKIVPAYLPSPRGLVLLSGFFEVAGGVGLLIERTRRLAAWGLVALYVSVFPANLYQAMNHIAFDPSHPIPPVVLWLRLPLQIPLIALAAWFAADDSRRRAS